MTDLSPSSLREMADDCEWCAGYLQGVALTKRAKQLDAIASVLRALAEERDPTCSECKRSAKGVHKPGCSYQHVCGLHGYNPMIDPMCPACERSAAGARGEAPMSDDTLHRFWCSHHGDYSKAGAQPCSTMAASCPQCDVEMHRWNTETNKDRRLGPMDYPRLNRCWCQSPRRHSGMREVGGSDR